MPCRRRRGWAVMRLVTTWKGSQVESRAAGSGVRGKARDVVQYGTSRKRNGTEKVGRACRAVRVWRGKKSGRLGLSACVSACEGLHGRPHRVDLVFGVVVSDRDPVRESSGKTSQEPGFPHGLMCLLTQSRRHQVEMLRCH